MQPYQKAADATGRMQRQTGVELQRNLNVVGKAASLFPIGKAGSQLLKALPFLNEFIPEEMSLKGLKKVAPKLYQFFEKSMKDGESFDSLKKFVSSQIENGKEKMEKKPSIFQQLIGDVEISTLPESQQKQLGFLQMAAEELEKKGVGPNDEPFKKLAKKIKDVLKGKTKVLEAEAMEQQPIFTTQEDLARHNANYEAQQPSQQAGPGQQALMAILQKIQAQRAGGG